MTLSPSVIVALSCMVVPAVPVTLSVVNVGAAFSTVMLVFSLVSFSHCADPEYTACIVVPSFAQSSGTR